MPFTVAFVLGILLQGSGMGYFYVFIPLLTAIFLCFFKQTYSAILIFALSIGFIVGTVHDPAPLQEHLCQKQFRYSGVVRELNSSDFGRRLIVLIDSCNDRSCKPFLVKMTTPSMIPDVTDTDRLSFTASMTPLRSRLDLPDEYDFNEIMRRKGVVGECFVSPDSLMVLFPEPGLLNSIRRMRPVISGLIACSMLDASSKEFLNAALSGDRSMLSIDTMEIFSATGISHILALSGLHVGIIAWILSLMFMPLYIIGCRGLRSFLLILLLWIFAILTGFGPSVVRAVVMATIFIISYQFQRVSSPFNSLCVAAILILMFNPQSLYTIGFQMSFIAVISILVFAGKLNPFSRSKKIPYIIFSYVSVTISAMLGTGIVSAYYFNIFPLYFIPVNFLCAVLLPFILGGGMFLLLTEFLGIECSWLVCLIDFLYGIIHSFSAYVSTLPRATLQSIYVPPFLIVACFFTLAVFAIWLYRRRTVYLTAATMLGLFMILSSCLLSYPKPGMEVYIPRSSDKTSILIRRNDTLHIATTAPFHEYGVVMEECQTKYRKYMIKRGIDSIRLLPAHHLSPYVARNNNIIAIPGCMFVLISDIRHIHAYPHKINYAVICNGFRGDVMAVSETLSPDTIILSSDLNRRRHDRYVKELLESGIPCLSLRENGFMRICK